MYVMRKMGSLNYWGEINYGSPYLHFVMDFLSLGTQSMVDVENAEAMGND